MVKKVFAKYLNSNSSKNLFLFEGTRCDFAANEQHFNGNRT
jgi:hypothetical protein